MTKNEIMQVLHDTGALLQGHFLLRSGLHSDRFFQAAMVLQYPRLAEELCRELAGYFGDIQIDTVLSPATGGIIVGQEVARALETRAVFAEKGQNDQLLLRRGFKIEAGEKVLVAEDVVTKGGRVQQTLDLVHSCGAIPVGVAVLVDRSDGDLSFGVPFSALIRLNLKTYAPETCPLCKEGTPLETPGTKV